MKFVFGLFFFLGSAAFAQITQTIRGSVMDRESQFGIPGAIVVLVSDTTGKIKAITDGNGNFRLENVPLGRHTLRVSLVGYQEYSGSNIIVDSGKETILSIELDESTQTLETVDITGTKKDEANNEMGFISVKTFNIEETNRYAGSRGDPGRMASNFAGVSGADDSRNDIVIRGNSPMGLLWRIEGVDVPNPNHFAVAGTAGGAISILNNKVFGPSDFFTGAFPAEYGNANAGVFDIRLRNGNNEKHELTGQLGFLGTEFFAEGPLSKKSGATYLLAYRYSTLKLFSFVGIQLGTSAVPSYQDLSFKLNFPGKKSSNFSIFGVGGYSTIDIKLSDKDTSEVEVYGDNNRDQYFTTSMGLVGMSWSKSFNEKSFLKIVLSGYTSYSGATHDIFTRDSLGKMDTLFPKLDYKYFSNRGSLNIGWTRKFNAKHSIKTGLVGDMWMYNMYDSVYLEYDTVWVVRNDYKASTMMIQPFIQWKYKHTDNLTFSAGIHSTYYSLNGDFSIEPRAGVKLTFNKNNSINFGYGLHSQALPAYISFHQVKDTGGNWILHNKDLAFTNSHHLVLGYDRFIGKYSKFRAEAYFQYLFDVPVDTFLSSFSLVNQGSTFSRFFPGTLVNNGTAYNYGFELTYEKGFSKSWYMLLTGAVYDARYKGSDGIERKSDFNGGFATNALIGKEFKMGKKKNTVLTTATKITYAGGKLYSPVDTLASVEFGELMEIDSLRNTLQFDDYFRLDLKIGLKANRKKVTHEIGLDLVNLLGIENALGLSYSGNPNQPVIIENQLGFLPLFYYKIDF